MSDGIRYKRDGYAARVTIDRPKALNARDSAAQRRLEEIWQEIESSSQVRVVVLTGTGDRAFCVGADMSAAAVGKTRVDCWTEGMPNGFGWRFARPSTSRSSPGSTATRSAADWRWRWDATSSSPPTMHSSICPNHESAASPSTAA